MNRPVLRFHHDFVDPASYLVHRMLQRLGPELEAEVRVEPVPLELRQPPDPLIDPGDREWRTYLAEMAEEASALGLPFGPPRIVPWTRKAHELAVHADEKGRLREILTSIYGAYFAEGRDIGRVDVLVDLATDAGLDSTEAKAVLDVDRHDARIAQTRRLALETGIRGVPTLVREGRRLEGFHPEEEIRTFLNPTGGG